MGKVTEGRKKKIRVNHRRVEGSTNRAQCSRSQWEDSGKKESGGSEDTDRSSKLKKIIEFGNFVTVMFARIFSLC